MAKKSKPKFPPLAPGSKISFDYDYSYIGGVLFSLEIVACWAAAEWRDEAERFRERKYEYGIEIYNDKLRLANLWDDFRRENCK